MGAAPTALLVCFAGPPTLEVDWVLDLAAGIAAECASVGAQVAGGDTSSAGSVLLAITALGDLAGRAPVTRSGARPGDAVAIAGTLGAAAAGLELLKAGVGDAGAVVRWMVRWLGWCGRIGGPRRPMGLGRRRRLWVPPR